MDKLARNTGRMIDSKCNILEEEEEGEEEEREEDGRSDVGSISFR